jgi:histidine ammonia-lyase
MWSEVHDLCLRSETETGTAVLSITGCKRSNEQVNETVMVGTGPLDPADVVAVARYGAQVRIDDPALEEIAKSRAAIEALAHAETPHYGVSTGFGALATRHIAPELRTQLQRSLVRSHAAGSGAEVEREVVRALVLLRLSTLATGRTGVKVETAQAYADLLNAGLTPVVHEYGSLGCSGDLAPLAHVALAVMGEGQVRNADGELQDAEVALQANNLSPIVLAEKEGLALINGTDGMLACWCSRSPTSTASSRPPTWPPR